jgi:putative Mg2+ transporter-C (MgtC) family protein
MITTYEIVLRLAVAALLGSLIGIERERRAWTAGLRTHMLVCVSASLLMIVSAFGFADVLDDSHVILDPSRVAAQVVSGIGFLGAGIIIFRREAVRGLTTAASVWSVAAIGLATGGGMFTAAVFATGLISLILAGLKPIEARLLLRSRPRRLELTIAKNSIPISTIAATLASAGLHMQQLEVEQSDDVADERFILNVRRATQSAVNTAIEALRALPGVRAIRAPLD